MSACIKRSATVKSWYPMAKVVKNHTPDRKYKLYVLAENAEKEYVVRVRKPGKWIIMETLAKRNRKKSEWVKEKDRFSPDDGALIRTMRYEEVVAILLAAN